MRSIPQQLSAEPLQYVLTYRLVPIGTRDSSHYDSVVGGQRLGTITFPEARVRAPPLHGTPKQISSSKK